MALQLAKRGVGQTGSNPSVGCLIVKNSKIIGRGTTGPQGTPHAERAALNNAVEPCNGATMFVTLEPCSHHGKTPPCVKSIIDAKISRVVCPVMDPDPRVSGFGFEKLRQANIQVDIVSFARAWAEDMARGFISRVTRNRPFITVKLAMTLDGKIATKSGKSQWITNEFLRARSHLLRVKNDAVIVGTNTFINDNPKLNIRGTLNNLSNPLRIFLDRNLRVFPSNSIVTNVTQHPAIIVCGSNPNPDHLKIWRATGTEILKIPSSNKNIQLKHLFKILAQRGINSVLVEGGGQLVKSLLQDGLVDEFVVHRSGIIIGSDGTPSVFHFNETSHEIDSYPKMELQSVRRYADNLETTWKPL